MVTASEFNQSLVIYPEIPETLPQAGWKDVSIIGSDEGLVPLGAFAGDPYAEYKPYSKIFTDAMYFAEHESSPYKEGQLKGALLTAFVRKSVADALLVVQSYLPQGHAFVVWDSFRTLGVQQALFDDYRDKLIVQKNMTMEEATEAAQQFVSIPSTDPTRPSPHNTGASVDLSIVKFTPQAWNHLQELNTIIDAEEDPDKYYFAEMKRMQLYREAIPLNMGTVFDEMSEAVSTRYFEDRFKNGELLASENEILMNRRMLVDVMRKAGMSNYFEEWFHFDLNNQFDARRMGKDAAIYGAAVMSEKNWEHEHMRCQHRMGSEFLRILQRPTNKLGEQVAEHHLTELVRLTAGQTGVLGATPLHPKGSKLEVYP